MIRLRTWKPLEDSEVLILDGRFFYRVVMVSTIVSSTVLAWVLS